MSAPTKVTGNGFTILITDGPHSMGAPEGTAELFRSCFEQAGLKGDYTARLGVYLNHGSAHFSKGIFFQRIESGSIAGKVMSKGPESSRPFRLTGFPESEAQDYLELLQEVAKGINDGPPNEDEDSFPAFFDEWVPVVSALVEDATSIAITLQIIRDHAASTKAPIEIYDCAARIRQTSGINSCSDKTIVNVVIEVLSQMGLVEIEEKDNNRYCRLSKAGYDHIKQFESSCDESVTNPESFADKVAKLEALAIEYNKNKLWLTKLQAIQAEMDLHVQRIGDKIVETEKMLNDPETLKQLANLKKIQGVLAS